MGMLLVVRDAENFIQGGWKLDLDPPPAISGFRRIGPAFVEFQFSIGAHDGQDGAEDLLEVDPHRRGDVVEQGAADEEPIGGEVIDSAVDDADLTARS